MCAKFANMQRKACILVKEKKNIRTITSTTIEIKDFNSGSQGLCI